MLKLYRLLKYLPVKNIILFESVPDCSDNTMAVYNEFIKNDISKKYKCIWLVSKGFIPLDKRIKTIEINSRKALIYQYLAKCIVCCNRFVNKQRNGQVSFYLTHGTPLKLLRNYYVTPDDVDYVLTASEKLNKIYSRELNFDITKCMPLGFPRNDLLITTRLDLNGFWGRFSKFIVWYPTVRQFVSGRKTGSKNSLPIIHDYKNAVLLNEAAKKNNTLVIIKPHFAQDISYLDAANLSNLVFINDTFFTKNNISSYEFVGSCDALITDYSSIYFDYLLCDRPIGLIWEDLNDFKINPGLIEEFDSLMKGGVQIYTIDNLCSFIEDVANNTDALSEVRNTICNEVNYSRDGKSSKRVVDYIVNAARL